MAFRFLKALEALINDSSYQKRRILIASYEYELIRKGVSTPGHESLHADEQ